MTLWEAGLSDARISLNGVRQGDHPISDPRPYGLTQWADIIGRGGWPSTLDNNLADALDYVVDYLTLIAETDVSQVAGMRRDPNKVTRLLASLARSTATQASITTLSRDTSGTSGALNRETVSGYLDVLERLMVIEPLPAWQTALRDSARLRQAPKWHFVDPSLAVAAMGATPDRLVAEPKTLGLLFESLAVRDLRAYSSLNRGKVFHARDSAGREVDAIIEYPDGWVACEIKLGLGQVDDAAQKLIAFTDAVDTQTVGPCLARVVIIGIGPGYRRPDGVLVVPLSSLCP